MSRASRDLIQAARQLLACEDSTAAHTARSVSTAYYAIFEHICCASSDLLIGKKDPPNLTRAREHLHRSISHEGLAKRCKQAQKPSFHFPTKIVKFSNAVFITQQKRIKADYQPYSNFSKSEADSIIGDVEAAMNDFDSTQRKHRVAFIVWALFEKRKDDQ